MIKLIAADMDGTLLNGKKQLSKDMFRVVRELDAKGVRFVAASGRQCANLANKFHAVADELYYIGESGATVFHGSEVVHYEEIPPESVRKILACISKIPDTFIVLAGLKSAYYVDDNPAMIKHSWIYYYNLEKVSSFDSCIGKDPICKIAIMCKDSDKIYSDARVLEPEFKVIPSDSTLIDILMPGVSKAKAMEAMQKIFNIKPEECMAFGDYLNDYEMIKECPNSYAMLNAHPELKKVAAHITEYDNEHHGVIRTICKELELAPPQDAWME